MGLQNRRTKLSWKQEELCFMIKIFLCIFGLKLPEQRCMYRTVLHIDYSKTRLLKKSSPIRNQKLAILEYLVVQCTYMFPKKRGQSYTLQGIRAYSLGIVTHQNHTIYNFQDSRRLRPSKTLLLKKTQLTTSQVKLITLKYMKNLKSPKSNIIL